MIQKPFRAPAYPLINIDPYTSIWSMANELNNGETKHWSGKSNILTGTAKIDGKLFYFMGGGETKRRRRDGNDDQKLKMTQTSVIFDSFSTIYTFEADGVELTANFTSPLLPDDMDLYSRPVTYLKITLKSLDGKKHDVSVAVTATSQLCLNDGHQCPVLTEEVKLTDGLTSMKMGGQEQAVLGKVGDGICIDWGYFYLTADGDSSVSRTREEGFAAAQIEVKMDTSGKNNALVLFAYDDLYSLIYFGERIKAWWKRKGATIEQEIIAAYKEYDDTIKRCAQFDKKMTADAEKAGGRKYAELLQLAIRQVMAAHKLVEDPDGDALFVSKECFSNGCAATVDVSYPSIPLFLIYNPELIKGMMRPIFKYATSGKWPFDFAPHDAGTYPILNGQVYSGGTDISHQMPVEECGNMLVMAASCARAEKNADFMKENQTTLKLWADYLLTNGVDPENQLCTDDFAGHLAHNCNLSVKAIMGIASYSLLCEMWNEPSEAKKYMDAARDMAKEWVKNSANGDGSTRLAFDQPGSVSMKYNSVWDKLFGTGLFPEKIIADEMASCLGRMNAYGLPLDNRADYTKTDWLVWTATLCSDKANFEKMVDLLHFMYTLTPSRVPMTDWYSTITSMQIGFQHRTVQGGLWIKSLEQSGKMK
ncbi:MAG: DUF4965 domain-containing protein [Oscillospiraceae bacterium]|nr:DUF4965 domain-containing protein [Oscillospiraceae bacterium]